MLDAAASILGTADLLIDSATLSVQWPGDAAFGPHVDRPLDPGGGDSWPYSARALGTSSTRVERRGLSVQVIWCLDEFTSENGAFFVVFFSQLILY